VKFGVVFPQTEIGADPTAVRDFVQTAEGLGLTHLLCFDHVIGASKARYSPGQLQGPYREQHMFHEPMVLFGYLAGITRTIELATGVIILPQRQTALLAKQAAEIDLLSGGRLRLGVGIGWNWVEYDVLGMPFSERGARLDEQIRLIRALWEQPLVTFDGRFHKVVDAGLNPLPGRRIPIWFGGMAEAVLKRTGEIGDGWYPMNGRLANGQLPEMIGRVRGYAAAAGRDPHSVQIDARIAHDGATPSVWARQIKQLEADGVDYISFNTMNGGLADPAAHIDALHRFRDVIPV